MKFSNVLDYWFVINSTIKYQEIFGGAFTDSTGIVINGLPEDVQDKFYE